jgi:hypothetical protein
MGRSSEWIDWQIMDIMVEYEDGAPVSHIAEHVGESGQLIAGRCKSLAHRGFLQKIDAQSGAWTGLFDHEYCKPAGSWWAPTESALEASR